MRRSDHPLHHATTGEPGGFLECLQQRLYLNAPSRTSATHLVMAERTALQVDRPIKMCRDSLAEDVGRERNRQVGSRGGRSVDV